MAWQYRRRKKIAPGVYLNIGKNGVSTSLKGGRGMSVTMGKNGMYLNTSIPGTGLYNRQKLFSSSVSNSPSPNVHNNESGDGGLGCLISCMAFWVVLIGMSLGSIDMVWAILGSIAAAIIVGLIYALLKKESKSSESFSYKKELSLVNSELKQAEGIKKDILLSYQECLSIAKDIDEEELVLDALRLKNKEKNKYQDKIREHETILQELIKKRESARFDAMAGLSIEQRQNYIELSESFLEIFKDSKVWYDDFSNVVEAGPGVFDYLKCDEDVPVVDIQSQGMKIFLYPLFWICSKTNTNFFVVPINEVGVTFQSSRLPLMEERIVPSEIKKIYSTYRYTTKNGSRDLRYSYNPALVIVEVGFMKFCFLDKAFMLSQVSEPVFVGKMMQYRSGNNNVDLTNGRENVLDWNEQNSEYSDYLKDVEVVSNRIYSIYKDCQTDTHFIQTLLNNPGIEIKDGRGITKSPEQAILDLFLTDIAHCYAELVDDLSVKKKEGIGISYLVAKLLNPKWQLRDINYAINNVHESFESTIMQYAKVQYNGFVVADLFEQYSREKRLSYLVCLHRFASITATADGQVSLKEQQVLSKMLSLENEKVVSGGTIQSQHIKPNASSIDKLNSLIGLSSVKTEVSTLVNFIKIQNQRKAQGLHVPSISYHCVFTGNPGTGKTTVARILASIYKELGVCSKGHLVEIDRSGLVAEYVGQTAVKTNKVVDSALDGVLFVDEAYSLISGGQNDYGKEAVDTLLKRMEDDRSRLVVIMAGYKEEMKSLINSNPGLQSRFNRYIDFPDYTADELLSIFEGLINQYDYCLTEDAKMVATALFKNSVLTKNDKFGNGRYVRNVFEKTLENQANRLSSQCKLDSIMLKQIQGCDIPQV